MKKVLVKKSFYDRKTTAWVTEVKGVADFHAFGVDFHETEHGIGNFSTAIVEWPDGTIENVPVNLVKFIVDSVGDHYE